MCKPSAGENFPEWFGLNAVERAVMRGKRRRDQAFFTIIGLNLAAQKLTITRIHQSIFSENMRQLIEQFRGLGAALFLLTWGPLAAWGQSPSISAQPQDQSVLTSSNAVFSVTASGAAPLSYQWRFFSTNLVAATNGRCKVYSGIGAGVGDGGETKAITPDEVREGVHAAYDGGASGILISRNYSEAALASLEAVGTALKERGL